MPKVKYPQDYDRQQKNMTQKEVLETVITGLSFGFLMIGIIIVIDRKIVSKIARYFNSCACTFNPLSPLSLKFALWLTERLFGNSVANKGRGCPSCHHHPGELTSYFGIQTHNLLQVFESLIRVSPCLSI